MTPPNSRAASVKQKLLNIARERGEEFNRLLIRYGIERFLYRLSESRYASDFVLKGATLFQRWAETLHRATRDLDLLGFGEPDIFRLIACFKEICDSSVSDDGVTFLSDTVEAANIREDAPYDGIRLRLEGRLGSARLRLQVDVGFGDATVPPPELAEFPTLLDQGKPKLRMYRRETVIAEKLHALVRLGMATSRMKDFFDLYYLAREFDFSGVELSGAIRATFSRRQTPMPGDPPVALSDSFASDSAKQVQWTAFLRRSLLEEETRLELEEVIRELRAFLLPCIKTLASDSAFDFEWQAGGPWSV